MTSEYTSNSITVTIPSLADNANVVLAFQNYHDDVANAIASKQATITGAATSVISTNLSADVVVVSNATGKLANSSISTTELGTLNGLSLQSQILNPTGIITPYAGFSAPDGWLFCNGATITKSSYPNLANILTITETVESMAYEQYNEGEASTDGIRFTLDPSITLPSGGNLSYPFYGYIVADSTAMSGSGLGTYYSANTMYRMQLSDNLVTMISDPLIPVPSNFTFNNISGEGNVYSIQIVINAYRKTTSDPAAPTISETTLPNLLSRLAYGPTVMGANVGAFGGSQSHTHDISSLYADIDIPTSSNVAFSKQKTVSSWLPTSRVSGLTLASNTTSSRTSGVVIGGSLATTNHLPPYFTLNYIIKT
jgi:microcystin-dependent protein